MPSNIFTSKNLVLDSQLDYSPYRFDKKPTNMAHTYTISLQEEMLAVLSHIATTITVLTPRAVQELKTLLQFCSAIY
jgi:hypothetical protein